MSEQYGIPQDEPCVQPPLDEAVQLVRQYQADGREIPYELLSVIAYELRSFGDTF